jgi:hypothetical protein
MGDVKRRDDLGTKCLITILIIPSTSALSRTVMHLPYDYLFLQIVREGIDWEC